MTPALWILGLSLLTALVVTIAVRVRATRIALRALHRSGSRIDRFKLTKKAFIRETLLADEGIARAVKEHAAENSTDERKAWSRVEEYIDEIVPFFNILTYYKIGLVVSRLLLNFFYKVSAEYAGRSAQGALPRDAIVIYLMNHRSNADYVLVGYVLSGRVAISYAVGEWARTFPLEYIFKSFGAYFIRRKYRERLYHTVLERYVQLITRNGVTQGIFLEGGLSRDGKLGKAKIGLLDYVLGVAREPSMRQRLYIVRRILSHGFEAYEDSPGVILSREVQKWVAELVGTIALAAVVSLAYTFLCWMGGRLGALQSVHPMRMLAWRVGRG